MTKVIVLDNLDAWRLARVLHALVRGDPLVTPLTTRQAASLEGLALKLDEIPDTTGEWLARVRERLVDDSDAYADVDLLYQLYTTITGEELTHPFDKEQPL